MLRKAESQIVVVQTPKSQVIIKECCAFITEEERFPKHSKS